LIRVSSADGLAATEDILGSKEVSHEKAAKALKGRSRSLAASKIETPVCAWKRSLGVLPKISLSSTGEQDGGLISLNTLTSVEKRLRFDGIGAGQGIMTNTEAL
jgi:hypothetical protein